MAEKPDEPYAEELDHPKHGKLNYNSYLQIDRLLALQREVSDSGPNGAAHHDEMFFIIIHQASELWFKEMLHETTILVEALQRNIVSIALKVLRRLRAIMDLLIQQIRLLTTLTPVEFAGFRHMLKPASGFQSYQFRLLEFSYGLRDPWFLRFFRKLPAVEAKLEKVLNTPSVYDELLFCLKRQQLAVPSELLARDWAQPREVNPDLVALFAEIYANTEDQNYHWVLLLETMIDLDEHFVTWRRMHATMTARTIGLKSGTGGSSGYEFLSSRQDLRCFPELWEVRTLLGQSS